jgi:orotate phosphoribosyltransferase
MRGEIMTKSNREELLEILEEKALEYGEYKLSSGVESSYYIDGRKITLDPKGTYLTADLFLNALRKDEFDAVGGPTIGADAIVASMVTLSYSRGNPLRGFIVRKQPKQHGKKQWIEGSLESGSRVVIVDDVITSGESILSAIEKVEEFGCKIVKVAVLVERLEAGAREKLEKKGYQLISLFTSKDFGV